MAQKRNGLLQGLKEYHRAPAASHRRRAIRSISLMYWRDVVAHPCGQIGEKAASLGLVCFPLELIIPGGGPPTN